MEARGRAEMPIMQEGTYAPPVHMIKLTEMLEITLSVGSSGRGSVSSKLSFGAQQERTQPGTRWLGSWKEGR
jgi:hypothetical protein